MKAANSSSLRKSFQISIVFKLVITIKHTKHIIETNRQTKEFIDLLHTKIKFLSNVLVTLFVVHNEQRKKNRNNFTLILPVRLPGQTN